MKYTVTVSLYDIQSVSLYKVSLYEIHNHSEFVRNTQSQCDEIHSHGEFV